MEKINDPETYKSLVKIHKNGRYISNCFFMPDKVRELIAGNKLFYEESEDHLFLYEKEEGFNRFYYWISDARKISPLRADHTLVIEFPYNEKITDKQREELAVISRLGFKRLRESSQMSVKAENVICYDKGADENLRFDFARKKDSGILKEILYSNFNPLFAFLPDDAKMERLIRDRNLIVAYYNNEIAGVLNMEKEKNIAWTRQLALQEKVRGKGIGGKLYNEGHAFWKDKVSIFRCWVDIHNVPSVGLHKKFGYQFDNRKADEYVLQKSRM